MKIINIRKQQEEKMKMKLLKRKQEERKQQEIQLKINQNKNMVEMITKIIHHDNDNDETEEENEEIIDYSRIHDSNVFQYLLNVFKSTREYYDEMQYRTYCFCLMKTISENGKQTEKWTDVGLNLNEEEKQSILTYLLTNFKESKIVKDIQFLHSINIIINELQQGNISYLPNEYQERCKLNGWNLICEINLMNEIINKGNNQFDIYLNNNVIQHQIRCVNKITSKECQLLFIKSRFNEMKKAINHLFSI